MSPPKPGKRINTAPARPVADLGGWIDACLTRRGFLLAGVAAGAAGMLRLSRPGGAASAAERSPLLGFKSVPAGTADTVTVPEGYRWRRLISWGDPLFRDAPPFDPGGASPAAHQARQLGDNNDGMSLFPLSPDRALLVVNNETCNYRYLFHHGGHPLDRKDVRKAQFAHGISIFEMRRGGSGDWEIDLGSRFNRRIHAATPMTVAGPAAGHDLLRTAGDDTGRRVLGTLCNCASGRTPWGTYLSCEENFNHYFGSGSRKPPSPDQTRYGIDTSSHFHWHRFDTRFDYDLDPNESHRFGWVVELDPMDPGSTPRKRTALGRLQHENAAVHVNHDGRVVVYMGDDEEGEHLYRFVTRDRFNAGDPSSNRDLLDEGTLYVAAFDAEPGRLAGTGWWIELTHGRNGLTAGNGFADQAEVLVFARRAATRVGATALDRPEWVAVRPGGGEVYCALTRNKARGAPGQPVGGPNPRAGNPYGQILRWSPAGGDHAGEIFDWDLYVMAGNPLVHEDLYAGSANIDRGNLFNAPDGIGFDAGGRLWIQTDGDHSNRGDFRGMGNNQMLCGDPDTGEIRRFLVGPVACEVTGLAFSPDSTTMFVGIQHPGEDGAPSDFPDGGGGKPRSSIIAITRDDGGVIGA